MKKYLLTLLIVGLTFVGFSSAQFNSTLYGTDCSSSICSSDGLNLIELTKGACGINLYCGSSNFPIEASVYYGNPHDYSYFLSKCRDSGYSSFRGFQINGVWNSASLSDVVISYSSSKMPVSELNPVINGLKSSINEFIPYLVYIGIGILSLLISFFGIRYLINWVRKKIFSSFK